MSNPRESQDTYRRQLLQNPAFSRVFSLSLSAHAALVALVGVCRVASIAPVACFLDDESKPPERRKPLKFMGFFSFCWKFGPFGCTTLCRFLFEIVANQKFSGTPPTFHQKRKKALNDLEHNQLIENCIMSIILLHSFKQSLPSTSWPEMKIMFSLCNGWDCLPIDKFLNSWFENI